MLTLITWLGHAALKIETTDVILNEPRVIYIDPWRDSPTFPESEKTITKADFILVTHGHFDHAADVPAISSSTGATVICTSELSIFMEAKGAAHIEHMNKGGTLEFGWGTVTMVGAEHSSGMLDGGYFGGFPTGYVLTFKDGSPSIYHAGDTNVFTDMKIISSLYKPKIAFLPIGGLTTMGPREAAYAMTTFLDNIQTVVPIHWGTVSFIPGTPQQLIEYLKISPKKGKAADVRVLTIGSKVPLHSLV